MVTSSYMYSHITEYYLVSHRCATLIHSFIHSFIHSVVSLMKGPQSLPKQVLHRLWSSASSSNFSYPVFSLRSSSAFLLHLPITSILPSIFLSVICFRRQFLHKMWPFQLAFLLFVVCRIFPFSLTLCNILHFADNWAYWYFPSFSSTIFQNFPDISDLLSKSLSWPFTF